MDVLNISLERTFCIKLSVKKFVMRCAIWYHLYNLKNVKNTHRGVFYLVKLQTDYK